MKLCLIDGCDKKHYAFGLCCLHYSQRPERRQKRQSDYQKNKERDLAKNKEWRTNNPDKIKNYAIRSSKKPERMKKNREIQAKRRLKNPELNKAQLADWRAKNKDHVREYNRKYSQKRQENPINRIALNLRRRLFEAVSREYKTSNVSAVRHLGCSLLEFRKYLESLFEPNMTWKNYGIGGWSIDHIFPLSRVNLLDEEALKRACHYTNLRPMWLIDNIKKSNKIDQ